MFSAGVTIQELAGRHQSPTPGAIHVRDSETRLECGPVLDGPGRHVGTLQACRFAGICGFTDPPRTGIVILGQMLWAVRSSYCFAKYLSTMANEKVI